MELLLAQLRDYLPPMFAGTELDNLTGKAICWRTIQNKKAAKEIPNSCFLRDGKRKLIVIRDPFLSWWEEHILAQHPN